MWPGACATVGIVTELVDVHATLGGGIAALDVVRDGGGRGLGGLLEGDGALDGGVPAEDSNYITQILSINVPICSPIAAWIVR